MSVNPISRQRGFTLIELVITIAVLAVLMAIALPSYNAWQRNAQVRSDARQVMGVLKQARMEAVSRNTVVSVTFANDGSWIVAEEGGAQITQGSLGPGSAFTSPDFDGDNVVMFNQRGFARDGDDDPQNGSIQVQGTRKYEITVTVAGNVSIELVTGE
jgi:type IV fimbrial biogenesis protein FimT